LLAELFLTFGVPYDTLVVYMRQQGLRNYSHGSHSPHVSLYEHFVLHGRLS
jgi:hypothetical protein